MSSVSRYQYLLGRFSWLAVLVTVLAALFLVRAYHLIPLVPVTDSKSVDISNTRSTQTNNAPDWSVFQSRDGSVSTVGGATSGRFRLAGTFFEYVLGVNGAGDIRRAIIDDLKSGTQVIVREGEKIDDLTVVKVFRDHVIIRYMSGSEDQLWLTFAGSGAANAKGLGSTNDTAVSSIGQFAGSDKFGGKQIGENKWIFSREKLLEYYKGLRDEPERLLKIFDSLKPIYGEAGANRINGYRLGIEGEADFFKSVGLDEGDIVRSVNSMQMTSRRRAEYFIGEFVADRANVFVLEVERGGKQEKLTYQIR